MRIHFCPRCHRRIDMPKGLDFSNIKIQGDLRVQCGRCPGVVIIKGEPVEEDEEVSA